MKRVWVFGLLGILWFCLAVSVFLFVDDLRYALGVVFLPMVIALINAARPRRGMHYIYWNRYLAVFGGMLLGMAAVPIVTIYLIVKYNLPTNIFVIAGLLWMILFIPSFILWFKFSFMPAWGPWRLRKRYPQMVAAASRLKKFGESYLWYFPLIRVQDKPYLVVGYNAQRLNGLAAFDEEGRFVKDEALALTLLRCYKLATAVLHMPDSQKRAQDIESHQRTDRQTQLAFQRLRENKVYFQTAGQPMYDPWKNLCLFEPYVHAFIRILINRTCWQAQWARDQGLNRLTEVSDRQLTEVEGTLARFNKLLADQGDHLDQIATDAEVLLKYVQGNGKSGPLQHRPQVVELLKSMVILRQAGIAWQKEVTDFQPLQNEWQAWQRRRALAEKLAMEGKL